MQEGLILEFGAKPELPYAIEEAVNRLRINISFLGKDVRKIMIASSEPNEGKSFVAYHLWDQIARSGERALLIDADMRNSNMFFKYAMTRSDGKEAFGLSHYLSRDMELDEVRLRTENPTGDFIPNVENVVNPSMLLENRKFEELLEQMAKQYRYVFVDVPPLGIVSDGERIGNLCDGAILCVRGNATSKALVRESVHQLERSGCPLLGIVLNRVGDTKSGYYHKYYGNKYYGGSYYGDNKSH